jgi:hypothetical protein
MGTLVATRDNPQSNALYERLLTAGNVKKSRPDGVHAYVADHAQCHAEASDALATTGGPKLKK